MITQLNNYLKTTHFQSRNITILFFIIAFPCFVFAQKTITILHVNDTHSHLLPWGSQVRGGERKYGGAARWITKYKQLRDGAVNPLFLHGGDFFTGDYFFNRFLGRGEFELFDRLGLDAAVLGNHEFDAKPFRLKKAIITSGASFDVLSSNIVYNNDTSQLSSVVKPYVVKYVGNLTVGIFGLTTRSTEFYGEQVPITFSDPIATAQRMIDTLKTQGIDFIIALSHLGVIEDSALARQVNDIDVIVGGHSHTPLFEPLLVRNPDGDTTIIVQAGAQYRYIGKLTLTKNLTQRFWSYQFEEIDINTPEDMEFSTIIRAYKDSIENVYGSVYSDTVGVLLHHFPPFVLRSGDSVFDHPFYNLITDSYCKFMGADAAIEIPGLAQKSLYQGLITPNDIRQVFGWSYDSVHQLGKRLTRIEVTGGFIKQLLNFAIGLTGNIYGPYFAIPLQVSGIQYTIDASLRPFRVSDVWIRGEPLRESEIYSVVINQFTADLIRRLLPFNPFITRMDTTFGPADALSKYIHQLNTFSPTDIQMGRVWEKSTVAHITFSSVNKFVQVKWISIPTANGYNVYRKLPAESSYKKLNDLPIHTTIFLDTTSSREQTAFYQIEELRGDAYRYVHPPVLYDANVLPQTFYLQQNYPNPFNDKTIITFAIPTSTFVTLRVVNLLGQVVKVLVDEVRTRDTHIVTWDGTNLDGRSVASGVYYVQMIAGEFNTVKPCVLIR